MIQNRKKIYITAFSAISALGLSDELHLKALKEGRTGIGTCKFLDSRHRERFPLGEVDWSNDQMKKHLGLTNQTLSRTELLALMALNSMLQKYEIKDDASMGLFVGTTVGGMDYTEKYLFDYLNADKLEYALHHILGETTQTIAKYLNITGYRSTLSTACSSSANVFISAWRLMQKGILQSAIVGGSDSLSAFTLNGFNTLMILDSKLCRPFDATREGLNLGEAAAFLLLETDESLQKSGRTPIAILSGFANVNDAFHQTASSPEGDGAYQSMAKALQMAAISAEDISYVNAHGTGTLNNDLSEGKALQKLFAGKNIPFNSTKTYTGHTLGAAGALEAYISMLCLQHQFIPATLSCDEPMPELEIVPFQSNENTAVIENILSNSFGFGGNNSSLLFTKYK